MSEEVSESPAYTRGRYRTYKRKYASVKETSINDAINLLKELEDFRTRLHVYNPSQYKSKILENTQGLIDCLKKYIERHEGNKQARLERKIKELEKRISELEATSTEKAPSWNIEDLNLPENIFGNTGY